MHREVLVLVITITTMNICTMEDSSIMLMRTIYTMYKGERVGGDLDAVEPHRGLMASPKDSLDGDLIP